jgi:paraquat-inducible protein A
MSQNGYKVSALVLTLLGTALYVAGLVLPMATITTRFLPFVDKTESYNLLQTVRNLFQDSEYVLGVIIVLFTFVFPMTKFFSLFMGLRGRWREDNSRLYRWMRATGRWSFLDVFVVAILVVMLRVETMTGEFGMKPDPGIYCFGASVLLAIWAGNWTSRTHRATAAIE